MRANRQAFEHVFNVPIHHETSSSVNVVAETAAHTPTVVKYSSATSILDYSSVHTWTVRGLKRLCEGSSIESAPLMHQNYSQWRMVLTKRANVIHFCFSLIKSGNSKEMKAMLKADEILPTGGTREVFPREWYRLEEGEKSESKLFRNLSTVAENDSENEVVLQCEVCTQGIVQNELPMPEIAEPQAAVLRAVHDMLHKEILTDFELQAGGTVLKAHRAILSVQSPYFAAMMQPHTKESEGGCVEIKDVKADVLKQVLLFMYTGVAPALKEMPWDLLIAADKYQLQQLKRQCESHIARSLTVDNAAATAANASLFSCDLLWDNAVSFIKLNLCEVMRSPGWSETVTTHPEAIKRISELMG